MRPKCPYCGAPAVDVTCNDEYVKRYLCTEGQNHEFTEELLRAVKLGEAEPLIVL